jgi:hypothetical protein
LDIEGERAMVTLELEEGDRQLVLMALAALSLEKPGFVDALNRIAVRIDNVKDGRAELFDGFRRFRADALAPSETRGELSPELEAFGRRTTPDLPPR